MQDLGNKADHSKICERQFPLDWFVIEPQCARSIGYSRLQLKKEHFWKLKDIKANRQT